MLPPMTPDDFRPETDAHGFAATNVVRVRLSRGRGAVHFFRVWMKPDDLAFPPHERRIVGAEEMQMRARYAQRKMRGEEESDELRLDAGRVCRPGGMPQTARAGRDVGDSGKKFETQIENHSPVRYSWTCEECKFRGQVDATRGDGEPDGQFRARLTAHCFDQHAQNRPECASGELTIDAAHEVLKVLVHEEEGYREETARVGPVVHLWNESEHDGTGPIGDPQAEHLQDESEAAQ